MQRDNLKLIGPSVLARCLGLSPSWVRAKAALNELPHYDCGGNRRFDLEEVLAFLRREATEGNAQQAAVQ